MVNRLEQRIQEFGDELATWQQCRIWKVPEAWIYTPCDFFGFTCHGRAILIEAKMVSSRAALPTRCAPGVKGHQWAALEEASRAGAIALIAWAYGESVAVIDWDMASELSKGRKSIPWGAIDDVFKHDYESGDLLAPYLVKQKAPGAR